MKVAFVVQRCGREVNGGAESLCLQLAQRMAKHWEIDILTTCALEYMTWQNFYPAGPQQIDSVLVRRFPVDRPRNVEDFNRLSLELSRNQKQATLIEQEAWMRSQGPNSSGLLDYLKENKTSYDAFLFFGYLYATSYFGLALVNDRAWLEPLAHDEWTIYFNMWERFFSLPRGFIFNTEAERRLLQKRFPRARLDGPIAGIGIDVPPHIETDIFKARYDLTMPLLLYVGRIDESKGCAEMLQFFLRWKKEAQAPHKLVLLGQEVMPVPFDDDIVHLGFVTDEEKWAAMKSCDWLIMPSPHESLSIVLLETWGTGRPALVNGRCEVLARHCQESHGGLWYTNYAEWRTALDSVDDAAKTILGLQGQAYVRTRYTWDRIESDYLKTLQAHK